MLNHAVIPPPSVDTLTVRVLIRLPRLYQVQLDALPSPYTIIVLQVRGPLSDWFARGSPLSRAFSASRTIRRSASDTPSQPN